MLATRLTGCLHSVCLGELFCTHESACFACSRQSVCLLRQGSHIKVCQRHTCQWGVRVRGAAWRRLQAWQQAALHALPACCGYCKPTQVGLQYAADHQLLVLRARVTPSAVHRAGAAFSLVGCKHGRKHQRKVTSAQPQAGSTR